MDKVTNIRFYIIMPSDKNNIERTLANHLLASGTSRCLSDSVRSLTMSGKQAMNSRDWSLETASPRAASGICWDVSVDRYLED